MRSSSFARRCLVSSALLLAIAVSFAAAPASAQLPSASSQPARITHAIDESRLVTLPGNTPSLAQSASDQGPAPASMPATRMLLVLTRSTQQEADLQTYLESVQNASSPTYRQFLSPDEFGARFGIGDADLQSVQTWLTSHGFTVNKISRGRTAVEFSGTVGQLQSAFHTSIHGYLINGVSQWSNTADPQIPAALAPIVAGLASLNSFRPKAQFIRGPSGFYNAANHTITPSYTIGTAATGYEIFLGPADAATIYDTPTTLNAAAPSTTYTGSGVTIGIAGDSNIDITQNANYRTTFGLPANPLTVTIDGTDPGENGDAIEAYLDTEVANGIAPGANVILYTAADTEFSYGLFLAIQRALDDNQADILNVSFGGCEAAQGTSGNQYIQNLWQQAAAQGISVTVSTGDSGSAGCDNPNTEYLASKGLAVNGLGSTPYNIAVGGTDYDVFASNFPGSFIEYVDTTNTLANHRSALSYIPEEPWNDSTYPNTFTAKNSPISGLTGNPYSDNIVAGGGGVSAVYPLPSWQTSSSSSAGRNLPDVSFLAGNGFYGASWGLCTDLDEDANGNPIPDCAAGATANNFNLTGIGGTSAAAPAFAGMLALLKQKTGSRLGQPDYALYQLAKTNYSKVFHDVTTGDNSVNCVAASPGCVLNIFGNYFMSGYDAGPAYDLASGLGSVDASQMLSNWSNVTFTPTTSSLQLNGGTAALNISHGQSVTVADSVTGSGGAPAGNIALVDSLSPANNPNSVGIANFTLTAGSASGTTNSLPGGSYSVSAHYGGSPTFAESVSNAIPVTVAAESSTTTLKVVGIYDPSTGNAASTSYYGYIYLIDAQPYGNSASAANPNGAATGTVTFKNGTTTLGTASVASSGVAELQTTIVPSGSNTLTASFPGDASFLASTSSQVGLTIIPALTALQVSASATTINAGTSVVLTATFANLDSDGLAPTGTVTFIAGTTTLGTAPVTGTAGTTTALATASAAFTTSTLPKGANYITATYSGDANYAASPASPQLPVIVSGNTTAMTVTPATSTVKINQPLQVAVALPAASGGLPLPTGTVTVQIVPTGELIPTYSAPTAQVANGSAAVTIPANSLPLGSYTVEAVYSGDSLYYGASAIAPITVISAGTIQPTVTLTLPTAPTGGGFPVTVTVTGPSGDPVPTGTISWACCNTSWALVNGTVTFSYPFNANLTAGPNTVSLTYLGDSNYTSGTATGTVTITAGTSLSITPVSPATPVNQALSITVTAATVAPFAAPTGTITLSSGSYTSTATAMAAGSATITIPANTLPVGNDFVTASYSGDTYYLATSIQKGVSVTTATVNPSFTMTATAVTVTPGATGNNGSVINITPSGGLTGNITLTATLTTSPAGATDLPTLSFGTSSPVNIVGTNVGSADLVITTTAPSSAALTRPARPGIRWYQGGAALACLLLFGIPARRRRWRTLLGVFAFLMLFTGGLISCGGAGSGGSGGGGGGGGGTTPPNPGTTAGAYVITVTGTQGSITASTLVSLTVQ